MVCYESCVTKYVKTEKLPKRVFTSFDKAFKIIDEKKDLSLFDIRPYIYKGKHRYYRLRKGKYRAIFFFENDNTVVVIIGKREEVYKLWQQKQ
jgi:mRNA interferase RelE/StbE